MGKDGRMEVVVKNRMNEPVGTIRLSAKMFGVPVAAPLLHEVVQMQRASMRQGTAATKTRGLVRGGGRKPWRQKGTGRARAGSRRSPLWRGGAVTFGPQPRCYAYPIPKKKGRLALFMALSLKVNEGKLIVLDQITFQEVKTRSMAYLLKKLELKGKILIAVTHKTDELERVSRNLPGVSLLEIRKMNLYDLLRTDLLLTTQSDLERFSEMWRESA